jgi:DNA-binding MarR family transcriptional regulator
VNGSLENQAMALDEAAIALVAVLDPAGCGDVAHVSPTQLRALELLGGDSTMNVNGLAEVLSVNASSASRLCDRLEALGLAYRSADPRDRREVKLHLTKEARDLLDTLAICRQRALSDVLSRMPEQSRQELVRSLGAFADAYAMRGDEASVEESQRIA